MPIFLLGQGRGMSYVVTMLISLFSLLITVFVVFSVCLYIIQLLYYIWYHIIIILDDICIFAHVGVFLSDEASEWRDQGYMQFSFWYSQIVLYRSLLPTCSIWECLFPQIWTLTLPKGKIKISFCWKKSIHCGSTLHLPLRVGLSFSYVKERIVYYRSCRPSIFSVHFSVLGFVLLGH